MFNVFFLFISLNPFHFLRARLVLVCFSSSFTASTSSIPFYFFCSIPADCHRRVGSSPASARPARSAALDEQRLFQPRSTAAPVRIMHHCCCCCCSCELDFFRLMFLLIVVGFYSHFSTQGFFMRRFESSAALFFNAIFCTRRWRCPYLIDLPFYLFPHLPFSSTHHPFYDSTPNLHPSSPPLHPLSSLKTGWC